MAPGARYAPKGHNKTAQGNALGTVAEELTEALKGRNMRLSRPFRAFG